MEGLNRRCVNNSRITIIASFQRRFQKHFPIKIETVERRKTITVYVIVQTFIIVAFAKTVFCFFPLTLFYRTVISFLFVFMPLQPSKVNQSQVIIEFVLLLFFYLLILVFLSLCVFPPT